ncbi:MAG: DUF177 domain-containing protein [Clostridia bacterium]|nr:DUF177 domain-containing protein [Clostridia bacterium]
MELNVSKELKLPGEVSHARLVEEIEPIELPGYVIRPSAPVTVDLDYSFDGEGFRLTGTLSAEVVMNCTKCNDEFTQGFTVEFDERFLRVSETEAEEMEVYPFSGEKLDLTKLVQDTVLLNAPMYGLCKPDCRGLCPVCGANLNNTQCSCTLPDDGNPFAALKGLAELLKED